MNDLHVFGANRGPTKISPLLFGVETDPPALDQRSKEKEQVEIPMGPLDSRTVDGQVGDGGDGRGAQTGCAAYQKTPCVGAKGRRRGVGGGHEGHRSLYYV